MSLAGPVPPGYEQFEDAGQDTFSDTAGPYFRRLSDGADEVAVRWTAMRVERRHLNLQGLCHGGALLAFADEVLGATIDGVLRPSRLVTVDLGMHFLQPARLGDLIEARGEVTHRASRMVFASARMSVGDRLVATARGVFRYWAGSAPAATCTLPP